MPVVRACLHAALLVRCCATLVAVRDAHAQDLRRDGTQVAVGGLIDARVIDAETGRPVPDAAVRLPALGRSVAAGIDGRVLLAGVPRGRHRIVVTAVGYAPVSVDEVVVTEADSTVVAVALRLRPVTVPEIVVTAGGERLRHQRLGGGRRLEREALVGGPQPAEDVFRAMSRLPGVAASDFSARFGVRGGRPEEVSVRLDGVELVEPFHLRDVDGALGIVDPHALRGAELHPGGAPAAYGDHQSAVLELTSREAPSGGPYHAAGLTLANARLLSLGRLGARTTWLVSARRGYVDLVMRLLGHDDRVLPAYHDLFAKVARRIASAHTLAGHVLLAGDRGRWRERDGDMSRSAETSYASAYVWATWSAAWSARLGSRTTLSVRRVGHHRAGLFLDVAPRPLETFRVDDRRRLETAAVQQEWVYAWSERGGLRGGLDLELHRARYDYRSDRLRLVPDTGSTMAWRRERVDAALDPGATELGAFLSVRTAIGPRFELEVGARFDVHSRPAQRHASPRVAATYVAWRGAAVRAAWGLYRQTQGMHELQVEDGIVDYAPAELAEHRVLGLRQRLGATAEFDVTAYQKRLGRLRPRYVNRQRRFDVFPEAERDRVLIVPSGGEARGLEVILASQPGRGLGWSIAYALSSVFDRVGDREIPRSMDQRHAVALALDWRAPSGWTAGWSWRWHSGWPTTAVAFERVPLSGGGFTALERYGPMHAERLPPYHRMDLRVGRSFALAGGRLALYADVFNVYGRENLWGYLYRAERAGSGLAVRRRPAPMLPLLPTIGVSWER